MIEAVDAREILGRMAGKQVLVVGDLMLDRYVSGTVERISPEAPVPVVHVREERFLPGGAANVARGIQALGGQAIVAGAIGRDRAGEQLRDVLHRGGIRTDGVLETEHVTTSEKTRILADRQQLVRVDREDAPEALAAMEGELRRRVAAAAAGVDAIVIEDYGKGVITQGVVDTVLEVARQRSIPVGLDPKDNHELDISYLTLATPNYKEACGAAGVVATALTGDLTVHPALIRAAEVLQTRWHTEFLAITLGPYGMYLVRRGESAVVLATRAREVFDVCGAGDTVIATAMLAIAAGAGYYAAASLANYAAGVVVGKVGAATCSPEELLVVVGNGR